MTNKNTLKGLGNQVAGNTKEAAGKATGNRKLEAKGKMQELKGDAQRAAGNAEHQIRKAAEKLQKPH